MVNVANLSEQERRCVSLYYHDDKTYQEIAEMLNISKGTVDGYLKMARYKMNPLSKKVKDLIETFPDILERKQTLYDRLIVSSGENPLQEESLINRLDSLDRIEELVNAMLESDCISFRQQYVLSLRADGKTLRKIADIFNLKSTEAIRKRLAQIYKILADVYEKELQEV